MLTSRNNCDHRTAADDYGRWGCCIEKKHSSNMAQAPSVSPSTIFHYTREGLEVPDDATHVKVSAAVVPRQAFHNHKHVKSVEFLPGVITIGPMAFAQCDVLMRIQVPQSVNDIGGGAFGCNAFLMEAELPETLQLIPAGSFAFCLSFCSFRVPSGVLTIGHRAFWGCKRLLSIEIPQGLVRIGGQCFLECSELRNIALPSTASDIGPGAFSQCKKLQENMSGEEPDELITALKTRFDGLPVHKLCYYQGYHTSSSTIGDDSCDAMDKRLKESTAFPFDVFEMNPLHILVLSGKPSFELCKVFCKERMMRNSDCWGMTPIMYAVMNFGPSMVPIIKYISQRHYDRQVENLGLERWRTDIEKALDELQPDDRFSERGIKLRRYLKKIALYYTKEILSLLELSVWKVHMMEESKAIKENKDHSPPRKKAKIDSCTSVSTDAIVDRVKCRTLCKADIIIACVLPFISDYVIDAAP
jgi:hypothetical protein